MKNRIKQNKVVTKKNATWIGLQGLEARLTLAADTITASVHGGTLMIKGSKADAVIILDDDLLAAGEIRISTGDSGIKINHQSGDVVLGGITRDIKVVLGKGNDHITFDGLSPTNNISVVGGPGNDTIVFDGDDVNGGIKLVTGPGDDTLTFNDLTVDHDLSAVTGPGAANIALMNVDIGGKTNIQNGPSDDTLTIDDSDFHSVRVHTGTGSDTVLIETLDSAVGPITHFDGAVSISLDNGDDHMQVGVFGDVGHSVDLNAATLFDGGPGTDTLSNPDDNGASGSSHLTVVNFESVAPVIVATSPDSGATGVSVNSTITATFNVAMDADTINAATFTLHDSGGPVVGIVTYSGTTATFTPTAPLSAGTLYTVRISTGAKNVSGVGLVSDVVRTFTTA